MPETESLVRGVRPVEAADGRGGRLSEFELADVVQRFGPRYLARHPASREQRKVLRAIERCRTAALGGHRDGCDACGYERIRYNSCRNRHCPKCQGRARVLWVAARLEQLLPIEYFHVVFTLPHELNALCRYNQRVVLDLLFRAASQTLLRFGRERLGGEVGVTAALHTWGQTLVEHHHVHCIVTGGALRADGQQWVSSRRGYLFAVRALSAVYRGKYLEGLRRAFERGELRGGEALEEVRDAASFERFVARLAGQAWVVYAKRPFAGPAQMVRYVGRYTHRVAITNDRIVGIDEAGVSFTYKDYRDGGQRKVMRLGGEEFLGRYLRHVLPKGFQRIRHYGLFGRQRTEKLARCRALLGERGAEETARAAADELATQDRAGEGERCPACGVGRMVCIEAWPRMCGPPQTAGTGGVRQQCP
jgi:hypothetical protein